MGADLVVVGGSVGIVESLVGTKVRLYQSGLNGAIPIITMDNGAGADVIFNVANQPAARAYHSATQAITNNTVTALALNSEIFDTDSIHDLVTNNSRLTCKTAGLYEIVGQVVYAYHATGLRIAYLTINATTTIGAQHLKAVDDGTNATIPQATAVYRLAVNDYITLHAYQNSGGALNVNGGTNLGTFLSMSRICA